MRLRRLLAGFVVTLSFLQLLDIGRSQLWPVDGERELDDFAVEFEGHLISWLSTGVPVSAPTSIWRFNPAGNRANERIADEA